MLSSSQIPKIRYIKNKNLLNLPSATGEVMVNANCVKLSTISRLIPVYSKIQRDLSANDSLNQHFVKNFGNSFICRENSLIACLKMFSTKPFIFLENMVIFFSLSPQQYFINSPTTGRGLFMLGGPLQVLLQGFLRACGVTERSILVCCVSVGQQFSFNRPRLNGQASALLQNSPLQLVNGAGQLWCTGLLRQMPPGSSEHLNAPPAHRGSNRMRGTPASFSVTS